MGQVLGIEMEQTKTGLEQLLVNRKQQKQESELSTTL